MNQPTEIEIKRLIRFYERRGWSWLTAVAFLIWKHQRR